MLALPKISNTPVTCRAAQAARNATAFLTRFDQRRLPNVRTTCATVSDRRLLQSLLQPRYCIVAARDPIVLNLSGVLCCFAAGLPELGLKRKDCLC